MQTRPDHPTLLEAVAGFLLEAIAPKLDGDKALQFRVLIAANVVGTLANELRTADERFREEAKSLAALLPGHEAIASLQNLDGAERQRALDALNRALAQRLRSGALTPADEARALDALLATAAATLRVTNPRFELP